MIALVQVARSCRLIRSEWMKASRGQTDTYRTRRPDPDISVLSCRGQNEFRVWEERYAHCVRPNGRIVRTQWHSLWMWTPMAGPWPRPLPAVRLNIFWCHIFCVWCVGAHCGIYSSYWYFGCRIRCTSLNALFGVCLCLCSEIVINAEFHALRQIENVDSRC